MSQPKDLPADDEVMCDCSGTTRDKILQLCEQGVIDLDTISRKTGAMTGCGSCDYDIKSFVDDFIKQRD